MPNLVVLHSSVKSELGDLVERQDRGPQWSSGLAGLITGCHNCWFNFFEFFLNSFFKYTFILLFNRTKWWLTK